MSSKIKVLPTVFEGIKFRSRAEARWAVFFRAMGWDYEYEPEGYIVDDLAYLPDFWVPEMDAFVEVKPGEPDETELRKAKGLHAATGKLVVITLGPPTPGQKKIIPVGHNLSDSPKFKATFWLNSCRRCERAVMDYVFEDEKSEGYGYSEFGEACQRRDCGDRRPYLHGKMKIAYEKAAAERFGT